MQGLAHFLQSHPGWRVVDLGGLNQQNLDFVTGFGHRLYADNLLASYERYFTAEELREGSASEARMSEFLDSAIGGAGQRISAVLAWDRIQFLFPQAAAALVSWFREAMEPGGLLLAMFHPDSCASAAPLDCRIAEGSDVAATPRPPARTIEKYSPRTIERLFSGFGSVKFYVTRDSIQEVLVRR